MDNGRCAALRSKECKRMILLQRIMSMMHRVVQSIETHASVFSQGVIMVIVDLSCV